MDVPELGFADESGLSAAEKAFQDGHRAGLGGKSFTDNPHQAGSDGNREWEAGRMRGQAELLGVDAALVVDLCVTVEPGGDHGVRARLGKQVARDLPACEGVEGQVRVHGADDPVTPGPDGP